MKYKEWLSLYRKLGSTKRKQVLFCSALINKIEPWFTDPKLKEVRCLLELYAEDKIELTSLDKIFAYVYNLYGEIMNQGRRDYRDCTKAEYAIEVLYDITRLFEHDRIGNILYLKSGLRKILNFKDKDAMEIFTVPIRCIGPVAVKETYPIHIIGLAKSIKEDKDFSLMPILADALEEMGSELTVHSRWKVPHYTGCHVIDTILGE